MVCRESLEVIIVDKIKGFIDKEQLKRLAEPLLKSGYGQYLENIIEQDFKIIKS